MKSILVLATTAVLAVTQIGHATANTNVHLVSSTSEDMPAMSDMMQDSSLTSTNSATSTSTSTVSGFNSSTSASVTSAPTNSSSPFMNITSARTMTETLGGVRPSLTISGSLTASPATTTSPNAAATYAKVGAGMLVGVVGFVAAVL